ATILSSEFSPLPGQAPSYLVGAAFGLPAWVGYVAVRSFAIAAGRVKATTAIMLAAVPFHLVLTYWLVFGGFGIPALGALGAGIAYSLAAFFAWSILGVILHKSPDDIFKRAFSRPYTWNWPYMKQIICLGIPFMCRIVLAEGVLPVAGFIIAPFGSVALAGYAVSVRIIDLLSMFSFGFSEAAGIRAGIGAGSKQHKLVGAAGWVALQLSLMFNGLFGAALILFPNQIAVLFLGSEGLSTLQITDFALPLTAGVLLLGGIHNVIGGALNGLQDAKAPLIATALCAWGVGLPLAFLLSHSMSLPVSGLWAGLLGGDLVAAAIYLFLFIRWLHKLQRHSTAES
ncbi:MATE family efflux transporter, partial [Acidocella aminolytica]